MDELITIVVPVYNVSTYLRRCIGSIINQTCPTLQILLIDDGSTDDSGRICDEFARRDDRIEVIHQPNGGLSAARNAGLDRARGDWIAFVDSDDYVSPHYIEDMRSAAGAEDCDIAICRDDKVPGDGTATGAAFRRCAHWELITGYEASVRHFGKEAFLFNISWGKLFRAHLWDTLRFPVGKINEDVFVAHALLYSAKKIAVTDAVLYAYVLSDGSIMRSGFTERNLDVVDAWQEGVRFFTEADETELAHIAHRVYCSRVFDALCICKKKLPEHKKLLQSLRLRGVAAYRAARPIRRYIDCSRFKAFAYRLKFFTGRWCLPLYDLLFVRGRDYI